MSSGNQSHSAVGGILEPHQSAGYLYEVTLQYNVEYRVTVAAGHDEQDAIEAAEDRRLAASVDPADRILVHSDVTALDEVWADDPRAEEILGSDAPTAPSETTFWDDTKHFSDDEIQEYTA